MKPYTTRLLAGLLAAIVLPIAGAHAQSEIPGDLQRCKAIADDRERLACYDDALGRDAQSSETAEPEVVEVVPALTDDIGEEQLKREKRPAEEPTTVRGTVTNCRADASGRYYFYFDNGQVWKQKDSDRLSFRSCDLEVVIERDFFGYKMRIDGRSGSIRVSRVR